MNAPSRGRVEKPGEAVNVEWQTRSRPPTEYENLVGNALEQAFDSGAEQLSQVRERFEKIGFKDPQGKPWTEESLQAWLRQRA